MPCFKPNKVWRTPSGIQFYNPYSDIDTGFHISCKQCRGCRKEYARQWAMRTLHEKDLWLNNIFITLTYNDEHLPENNTLVKKDFQDFIKRLRKTKKIIKCPTTGRNLNPIRFYHCGEYGEKFGRPHYHAILFNHNFSDREKINGHKGLTQSETLTKIWGKGHSSIGDVTFESASYVAGYVQKKINGVMKDYINPETGLRHYERLTSEGEIITLQQEYSTMSRRPGIAGLWFAKHKNYCYPSDNIHINGREMRPPKYYDRLFIESSPENKKTFEDTILRKRLDALKKTQHLRTPEALAQAELNSIARERIYKRGKL
jgi:hypothetical protein